MVVENTALSQMRSVVTGAACCVTTWGYLATISRDIGGVHIGDTSSFDNKVCLTVKTGPLIPCERRLAKLEISENQEATFRAVLANRDYDRPFDTFWSTLRHFD